jgi:hypothetical protein
MPTTKVTHEILHAAILGFEEQKRGINVRIAELRAMMPGRTAGEAIPTKRVKRPRRKMSAAARKAIGDAQRERWAVKKARGKR